jgi:hypothetical protein
MLNDLEQEVFQINEGLTGMEDIAAKESTISNASIIGTRRANILLDEFERETNYLNDLINEKENKWLSILREKKRLDKEIEMLVKKKKEVINILENCGANCEFRNAFREVRNALADHLNGRIGEETFHFFLSYNERPLSTDGKTIIECHQDVIRNWGFAWWGKFAKKRDSDGEYHKIDPFGESLNAHQESMLSNNIQKNVRDRVTNHQKVYLYLYNPNPPKMSLHVCNVLDFWYGEGVLPYNNGAPQDFPQCAYLPRYYFQKREKMCRTCKKTDQARCVLEFLSNFWFKIDQIEEIKDRDSEFINLFNVFTRLPIDFSLPIFYPLLVARFTNKPYSFGQWS